MSALAEILAHPAIWRGNRPVAVSLPSLSTGFPVLDAALPGGGWPTAALIEILPQHEGIGELRILGHALSRWLDTGCLHQSRQRFEPGTGARAHWNY